MASLKDIRLRIESTKNTQQITRAMKLVSAAKLRKAQHQVTNMRPYAQSLLNVVADIVATERVSHSLLEPRTNPRKILLVVMTSDRGLCGAFNGQIIKYAESYLKENASKYEKIDLMFVGRRGADYFARKGRTSVETILKLDKDVSYELASRIAERMMHNFLVGDYDEIKLIYNEFKSAISQKPVAETMLPVDLSKQTFDASIGQKSTFSKDMIYEPDPQIIIDEMLVKHFSVQVYRAMCESVASEHGARMTAMESASNNARDMISKFTLIYNKIRQEKITTELTEIVSGAEALK